MAFSVRRMEPEAYKDNLLYTATRAYSMMFMSNIMADSKLADIYIELNTDGCSVYDISNIPELFRRGYSDACAALQISRRRDRVPSYGGTPSAENARLVHQETP